jgi:hypothetical protein
MAGRSGRGNGFQTFALTSYHRLRAHTTKPVKASTGSTLASQLLWQPFDRFPAVMAMRTFAVEAPSPSCVLRAALSCNNGAHAWLPDLIVPPFRPEIVLSGIPLDARCVLSVSCASAWPIYTGAAELHFRTARSLETVRLSHERDNTNCISNIIAPHCRSSSEYS